MISNDLPNPTPPTDQVAPRRLVRRREGKVLAGVCTGLADYLNLDVALVRVLTIVIGLATGIGLPAYLLAWLIVPEEGADRSELERLIDRAGFGSRGASGEAA